LIFSNNPRPQSLAALKDAKPIPFWLDDPSKPQPMPALTESIEADLLVIGGGYTGLWTALIAKESDPRRDVVLIEATECGSAASGRNGGFMDASLTHGFANGVSRWEREMKTLVQMGRENLNAIEATIKKYNIECDYIRSGEIAVALEEYQAKEMRAEIDCANAYGENYQWLDRDQMRAEINSAAYLGGLLKPDVAMVNPAQLAWGLRRVCLQLGVRLFERTPALSVNDLEKVIEVRAPYGMIRAKKIAIATNAFPPLLKRLKYYVVPVYDYALMTEPLTQAQRESIGWKKRQGIGDAGNQFHYYRTTMDGRILWGGYDAVYYGKTSADLEVNHESFARLAEHFFQTFPQIEGTRFTHAWGGAIDTCSRFNVFWGTAHNGRSAYALGYTGLGVGASRFGAQVMIDLIDGAKNDRTALEMARTKPIPFPPEPLRSIGINVTRWSLDQADRSAGKRNLWLRVLDALGMGFDS
jgi:glycine/D-amino acid oxidase-like deaminating enzyme